LLFDESDDVKARRFIIAPHKDLRDAFQLFRFPRDRSGLGGGNGGREQNQKQTQNNLSHIHNS
jgi:hypothetical protein